MPATFPGNLAELTDWTTNHPRVVELVRPTVGGGRFSVADVQRIQSMPAGAVLRVSGLDQPAFEALITRFGTLLVGLDLWKCPRIEELTPLEHCPNLTHVSIYWNQRATRLWDMRTTPALRGLRFQDFSRLASIADVEHAVALEELDFRERDLEQVDC